MRTSQQVSIYLQQLQKKYPQAFKRNYLFYSQIKTKGILDELREFIPWVLAVMIFVSIDFVLGNYIATHFQQFDATQAKGIAILIIMLFFMLIVPIIIKQIKHSSTHLYQQFKNIPLKLAVIIILQSLNIAFIQSMFLQGVLFFFALSFGFVKFYKENMFRESTSHIDYYQLQQVRRACFWSYKQALKAKSKLKYLNKNSVKAQQAQTHLTQYLELHLQLLKYENEMSKSYKFIDLDEYMDSLM
ncbi:hypothetical protein A7P53_03810 [Acinetobacter defluvii]|uniref:hypothetical protein n=1 Tax=Acinetobacter defluvii TaxID=1871111 RepID=UPI0014905DCD|nr:hypothetical protein [Acinetobacter defluvii]NNP71576.1 hypothetical protein [Acinetobacter defluvii]